MVLLNHMSEASAHPDQKICAGSGSKLNGDTLIMPYRDCLNRWLVVRLLPNMQRKVVARCRTQSDADGHLQILRRLIPNAKFAIMFDSDLKPDCQP